MSNRNSMLGRTRPTERLTKEEKASLDRTTTEPAPTPARTPTPANPPQNRTGAKQTKVRKDQLMFHWTVACPKCGFKVSGSGTPQPGKRMARCGQCKVHLFLEDR